MKKIVAVAFELPLPRESACGVRVEVEYSWSGSRWLRATQRGVQHPRQ